MFYGIKGRVVVPINKSRVSRHLVDFNFKQLFIEELGWDSPLINNLTIHEKKKSFLLTNIAEKRNVQIFACEPIKDTDYPSSVERRKIEVKVRKFAHEHLIIFIDREKTKQRWQWVFRKLGQPAQYKEHLFENGQGTEALLQKLDSIEININDEENLRLLDVSLRLRDGFDKDKVTKKFYDNFKKQQKLFRDFIEGIPGDHDQHWYSAVMLNRLMFIYFIQRKQFLNSDINYLKTKLAESREKFGDDNYYTFYRYFLRRLFHDGLDNKMPRGKELDLLFGKIPYLNGGIFSEHELEGKYPEINIKDKAFEKLFVFFDQYDWHLDDRPLENDKEINPDVLGYIFEKFINQKDMGAYYTKEDITEYISKNTIIPFLFDKAKENCTIAFEGERNVWDLLKDDPDRYFYGSVKKGIKNTNLYLTNEIENATISQCPDKIRNGLDSLAPKLLERRKDWNSKTSDKFALPTEIWRETITRWRHYFKVRQKLENGEINTINDLITYNLNIRQFAQDVIETWEGPELIRAFYKAITQITVLDPTVGSGAFLFAALNILEPLYEACIDRMQNFVDELPADADKSKFSDFKDILTQIDKHPNRQYFIYKSIIINNLYGVDIMEEAVEICKLRLFLKLVAQVETVDKIEPLPDIDFNIRSGNSLVGYVNENDVKKGVAKDLFAGKEAIQFMEEIKEKAKDVQAYYDVFLIAQMEQDESTADFKTELGVKLEGLNKILNQYHAGEYGINVEDKIEFENWLTTHQPFHWFVEFYSILANGGFDVIIGNPPYIEYSKVKKEYKILNYKTEKCGNLYAYCMEVSKKITKNKGYLSLIIPLASFSTNRMNLLQKLYYKDSSFLYVSNYEATSNPSVLFIGVKVQLSIIITKKTIDKDADIFTTNYIRVYSDERKNLFKTKIKYKTAIFKGDVLSRIYSSIEKEILEKLLLNPTELSNRIIRNSNCKLYYRNMGNFFFKLALFDEPLYKFNKKQKTSSTVSELSFVDENESIVTVALINSTFFYYYWILFSDCYHLSKKDITSIPFSFSNLTNDNFILIKKYIINYINDIENNSVIQKEHTASGNTKEYRRYFPQVSKHIIDEIDKVLAEHYGFTEEELDFIINYDIKYRMGKELNK